MIRKRLVFGVPILFALAVLTLPRPAQAQWGSETQLSTSGSPYYYGIAGSGNTVHTVRGDANDGQVYYRRSTDQGGTFGAEVSMGAGVPYLDDPLIADGTNVYLAYVKNVRTLTDFIGQRDVGDIYMKVSTDDGVTWGSEVQITSSQATFRMSVGASGSKVHVVWMDYRDGSPNGVPGNDAKPWHIYYRRSLDGGMTWQSEVKLVTGTNKAGAGRPQLAVVGDKIHLAWMDGRDNHPACTIEGGFLLAICTEVYYKRSLDGGTTWDPDARMTNDGGRYAGRPDIAASGDSVILLFDNNYDNTGLEQSVRRSSDSGATFAPRVRLTNAAGDSTHGSVAISGNLVHVAWSDTRNSGKFAIYYIQSPDLGATWATEQRLTNSPGDSTAPLVTVSSDYLHVAWGDNRSGSAQVWYRRLALPVSPPDMANSPSDMGAVPDDMASPAPDMTTRGPASHSGCSYVANDEAAPTCLLLLLCLGLAVFRLHRA